MKQTRERSVQVSRVGLSTVMLGKLVKMGSMRCLAPWVGLFTRWVSLKMLRSSRRLVVLVWSFR